MPFLEKKRFLFFYSRLIIIAPLISGVISFDLCPIDSFCILCCRKRQYSMINQIFENTLENLVGALICNFVNLDLLNIVHALQTNRCKNA